MIMRDATGRFRVRMFGAQLEAIGRYALWAVLALIGFLAPLAVVAWLAWDAMQTERALQTQLLLLMKTCGRGL